MNPELSFVEGPASQFLRLSTPGLVLEHSFFCPAASPAFLTPGLFYPAALGVGPAFLMRLDFVEQELASKKSICALLPTRLAFH